MELDEISMLENYDDEVHRLAAQLRMKNSWCPSCHKILDPEAHADMPEQVLLVLKSGDFPKVVTDWADKILEGAKMPPEQLTAKHEVASRTLEDKGADLETAIQIAREMRKDFYLSLAPSWEPLDSLSGVLSQIDNMARHYEGIKRNVEELLELCMLSSSRSIQTSKVEEILGGYTGIPSGVILDSKKIPPPGPPGRTEVSGFFGGNETRQSIRQRQDYEVFMRGYRYASTGVDEYFTGLAYKSKPLSK